MRSKEKAPWHTIILLFVLISGTMEMVTCALDTAVHTYEYVTAQVMPNRCPDYLQNQARVYIENVDEFYDYVCTQAEALGIPAEYLLMCMNEYSRFDYTTGLTLFSDSSLSAIDQVKNLEFRSHLDVIQVYAFLVDGIFHLTDEDIERISQRISEAYPTVWRINEELSKKNK